MSAATAFPVSQSLDTMDLTSIKTGHRAHVSKLFDGLMSWAGLTEFVLRPADANEATEAWKIVLRLHYQPAVLKLCRQSVPRGGSRREDVRGAEWRARGLGDRWRRAEHNQEESALLPIFSSFCRPTFAVDRSELRASPNPRCGRLLAGYMFTATLSPPAGFATEAFSSSVGPR
jgi:hypothetical protein